MFLSKWFPSNWFSKNEKPTIMDMPHLVMTQILDNVGFLTILRLRKVCKSFRNLIDDVKPINNLKIIRIYIEYRRIRVELIFELEEVFVIFELFYQEGPEDNSCCIFRYFEEPEFVVKKDEHFLDAFLTDFEPILKNQRSKLSELEIKVNCFNYDDDYSFLSQSKSIFFRFLSTRFKKFESVSTMTCIVESRQDYNIANEMIDGIWRILESRTVPLDTGKLKLIVPKSSQMFRLLRFIKTNSLHGNRANQDASSPGDADLTLDSKCETFKTMEKLVISKFYLGHPISDLLDIPKLNIILDSILKEDILFLKQAFLTNSHLKKWGVHSVHLEEDVVIHEVLGDSISSDQHEKWFFGIPNSEKFLFIHILYRGIWDLKSIIFTRINLVDVPKMY